MGIGTPEFEEALKTVMPDGMSCCGTVSDDIDRQLGLHRLIGSLGCWGWLLLCRQRESRLGLSAFVSQRGLQPQLRMDVSAGEFCVRAPRGVG